MTLRVQGHLATKKNGKMAWGGKVVTTRISKAETDSFVLQLRSQWHAEPLEDVRFLKATFTVRDGRGDLDGKYSTLQDLLVKARVIRNDSIARIRSFSAEAVINPQAEEGCEIILY
jgi:hypothetical protein